MNPDSREFRPKLSFHFWPDLMNQQQSTAPFGHRAASELELVAPPSPAWGAIFAGTVAGLAIHLLLLMLLGAIGFGAADPQTADQPVASFAAGTAIVWTVCALIALWSGGWVAGRCAARAHHFSGAMHGFLMWCVATLAAMLMVVAGAGALVGGAARIAGAGMSAMKNTAQGVADLGKQAVEQNTSLISSMVDEAADSPGVRNAAGGVAAARREIGIAARQLFRDGGNLHDPQARSALLQAMTRAGLSEADANRMIDRWTESAQQLRAQLDEAKNAAAAKARDAADAASKVLAQASLWSFIGFLLGAIVSAWGGRKGARWEARHLEAETGATVAPSGHGPALGTHA
jgi:hypothetical protein